MAEAKFIFKFNDWSYLLVTYRVVAGGLNLFSMPMQSHVAQHHDGTQQKGGGVRHVFACDIRGSSMYLTHAKQELGYVILFDQANASA